MKNIILLLVCALLINGCVIFSKELSEDTMAECERLGVSRECNTDLYAKQVSEMGRALLALHDQQKIRQVSYDIYAGVINTATQRVNRYSQGTGKLDDIADDINAVADFIETSGGSFTKIIDIFN